MQWAVKDGNGELLESLAGTSRLEVGRKIVSRRYGPIQAPGILFLPRAFQPRGKPSPQAGALANRAREVMPLRQA
jgi:hypothetical protein